MSAGKARGRDLCRFQSWRNKARALPVIEALAKAGAVVSADTRNAGTMRRALDAGARIINDVTAFQHDPDALSVVARAGCPVVLMHMRGTPATMMGLAVTRTWRGRCSRSWRSGSRRRRRRAFPGRTSLSTPVRLCQGASRQHRAAAAVAVAAGAWAPDRGWAVAQGDDRHADA